jgi:hypothetical protein
MACGHPHGPPLRGVHGKHGKEQDGAPPLRYLVHVFRVDARTRIVSVFSVVKTF